MYLKRASELEWISAGYPGGERAIFHISPQQGRTNIVRIKAGVRGPMHSHDAPEHAYVLSGKVQIGGFVMGPGDYLYTGPGETHDLVVLEDAVLFASTEGAVHVLENQQAA